MINPTIRQYIEANPNEKTFRVFRVSDGYKFKVKEINKENETVLLNTNVHLVVPYDSDIYLVDEVSLGKDFSQAKILRYVPTDLNKDVRAINVKKELITRLHSHKTWVFGRILKETFHPFAEDLKTPIMGDIIHSKTYDYEFDPNTFETIYRLEHMKWFNELGEVSHEKLQPKVYEGHEGMAEAKRRRANIIDQLKSDVQKLGGATGSSNDVNDFIGRNNTLIGLYIEYGRFELIQSIMADTANFLSALVAPGITVKMYMISKLDFITAEQGTADLYKGSLL